MKNDKTDFTQGSILKKLSLRDPVILPPYFIT